MSKNYLLSTESNLDDINGSHFVFTARNYTKPFTSKCFSSKDENFYKHFQLASTYVIREHSINRGRSRSL